MFIKDASASASKAIVGSQDILVFLDGSTVDMWTCLVTDQFITRETRRKIKITFRVSVLSEILHNVKEKQMLF